MIMHETNTILFSSLRLKTKKAHSKFQPNAISSFQKKVKQTDTQTKIENHNIEGVFHKDILPFSTYKFLIMNNSGVFIGVMH